MRFATIPGAIDFGTTFVAAIIKHYVKNGESQLFNSMTGMFTKDEGCTEFAKDFGKTLHYSFSFTAPDADYV